MKDTKLISNFTANWFPCSLAKELNGKFGLPPQFKLLQKEKNNFFATTKISQWPDPSLLFQFHILQIFWSTFQSLLQPLFHSSSAKRVMEPSSFDPLETCPAQHPLLKPVGTQFEKGEHKSSSKFVIFMQTTQESVTATGLAKSSIPLTSKGWGLFLWRTILEKLLILLLSEEAPELGKIYFSWKSNYFIAASQMEKNLLKLSRRTGMISTLVTYWSR